MEFFRQSFYGGYSTLKDPECIYLLVSLYFLDHYNHVDYKNAVQIASLGLEYHFGDAEELLGICYLKGLGVEQAPEKAFLLLVKGALLGQGQAQPLYYIGEMYRKGLFVEKEKKQAFHLYQSAKLEIGHGELIEGDIYLRLSDCYTKKIGTKEIGSKV